MRNIISFGRGSTSYCGPKKQPKLFFSLKSIFFWVVQDPSCTFKVIMSSFLGICCCAASAAHPICTLPLIVETKITVISRQPISRHDRPVTKLHIQYKSSKTSKKEQWCRSSCHSQVGAVPPKDEDPLDLQSVHRPI